MGDHGCLAGRLSPPVAGPCLADEPTERDDRVGEVEERAALVAPGNLLPFAREPDARLCRSGDHAARAGLIMPRQRVFRINEMNWVICEQTWR